MGSGVTLALVGAEAAGLLAALHAQCFARGWTKEAMAILLANPGAACLVTLEEGEPAGMLLYRMAGDEAEVLTLGVLPGRRERGLGGRLLAAALRGMTEAGAAMCFLEVAADNAAALALYRAAGFREVGLRPGYYHEAGRMVDALVLRRDLAP